MDSFFLSWIVELGFWSWAVLGILLLVLEVLLPGVFLFWFGLAALAVAVQTSLIPLPWQAQVAFFIGYSLVLVLLARRFQTRGDEPHTETLNKRGDALMGRRVTLDTAIVNGFGQVKIDDTVWRVAGPDTEAGTAMVIASADGALLTVALPETVPPEGDAKSAD